jgi:hypothetical protein
MEYSQQSLLKNLIEIGELLENVRRIANAKMKNSVSPKVLGSVLEKLAKAIETLQSVIISDVNVIAVELQSYVVEEGNNTIVHNKNLPVIGVYIQMNDLWIPYAFSADGIDPLNKITIEAVSAATINIRILLGSFTN